ncbi:hypothetical protein ANRL4_02454 [Anaerolineae bacterium]|nr:hypothetical protein ANRL4_02454 [Anaerolineae bacterium]
MTDASGLVYLRARYYLPGLGVFPSLDPVEEGNRYGYVGGDVVNRVDPTGMISGEPVARDGCVQTTAKDCSCYDNIFVNVYYLGGPDSPFGMPVLLTERQACQIGVWYKDFPECSTNTPVPAPSSQTPVIIFFGGSDGVNLNTVGPDPKLQTPVWVSIANLSVQYPGTKRQQAAQAVGYENSKIIAIGYSAGADTALIFADNYRRTNSGTGRITGVGVLGGTMSGTMMDGVTSLATVWQSVLNELLQSGANIYILDDKAAGGDEAASYVKPSGAPGIFHFEQRLSQEHWDGGLGGKTGIGTNNSDIYRDEVLNWFKNPVP